MFIFALSPNLSTKTSKWNENKHFWNELYIWCPSQTKMILTEVDFPPNSGAQGQANIKQIGPHHTLQPPPPPLSCKRTFAKIEVSQARRRPLIQPSPYSTFTLDCPTFVSASCLHIVVGAFSIVKIKSLQRFVWSSIRHPAPPPLCWILIISKEHVWRLLPSSLFITQV